MNSKRALREKFRAQVSEHGHDLSVSREATLNKHLIALIEKFGPATHGYWAGFQAIGHEPDISETMDIATGLRQWVFPRVEGNTLAFYHPVDSGSFRENGYGIREPDPARSLRVPPEEIRGLLIPGLAFDLKCNRLGRGRGYYDRALANRSSSFTPIKIGVAFERHISSEEIPVEHFDVPMDWVVTETRVLRRGEGAGLSTGDSDASIPERKGYE